MSGRFRVFISSTFDDFAAERNAFVRDVFPEVAAACRAVSLQFEPIDLRWGIPNELARDHRTMPICLEEVRRAEAVLVLAGDRYGWQPLPDRLSVDVFETIVQASPSAALLRDWFELDENATPAVRCLKSAQHLTAEEWTSVEQRLLTALANAARAPAKERAPRLTSIALSATELEARLALELGKPTCALLRTYRTTSGLDAPAGQAPQEAFKTFLRSRSVGEDVTVRPDGADHLRSFCERARTFLLECVQSTAALRAGTVAAQPTGTATAVFVGRTDACDAAATYFESGASAPLVILGPVGSGKSSLMSFVANELARRRLPSATIVSIFVGQNELVGDVRGLLRTLCRGLGAPSAATEIHELIGELWRLFQEPRSSPVVIVVDGLDQLTSREEDLAWLPKILPAQVRLLVSCADGALAEALKRRLPNNVVELQPFTVAESDDLLDAWLRADGRTLTSDQRSSIREKFREDPRPLFLRLIYADARHWRSSQESRVRASNGRAYLLHHLQRLRSLYGEQLVNTGLGYIRGARHGLSDLELLDLLSSDPAVMAEFESRWYHTRGVERIPLALWMRFLQDLGPFLAEREVAGTVLLALFHRELAEVVTRECYEPNAPRIHVQMERYFGALAADEPASRRGLAEWPRHQVLAGDPVEAGIHKTMHSIAFIEHRVRAGLIDETIEDFALLEGCLERAGGGNGPLLQATRDIARIFESELATIQGDGDLTGAQLFNGLVSRGATEPATEALLDRFVDWRRHHDARPWLRRLNASPYAHTTRALRRVLTIRGQPVRHLAVTPNGKYLVGASADGKVRLWFAASGLLYRELTAHEDGLSALALHTDGDDDHVVLVTAGRTSGIRIWDLERAAPRAETGPLATRVNEIATCGRMDVFFAAMDDRIVRAWDFEARRRGDLRAHTDRVRSLAVAGDGHRAISGGDDLLVRVWDLAGSRPIRVLGGHLAPVLGVAISEDGARAVTASADGNVSVWNVADGQLVRSLDAHRSAARSVALLRRAPAASQAQCEFATGGDDETVRIWDAGAPEARVVFPGVLHGVNALVADPRGRWLAAAGEDGFIRLWSMDVAGTAALANSHDSPVTAVVTAVEDDGLVTSAGQDGAIRTWHVQTGQVNRVLRDHRDGVTAVVALPDGRLASTTHDGAMRLWSCRTGRLEKVVGGVLSRLAPLSTRASGDDVAELLTKSSSRTMTLTLCGRVCLLLGGQDQTLKLLDGTNGRELHSYPDAPRSPHTVLWLSKVGLIVAAGAQPDVVTWEVEPPRRRRIVDTAQATVTCMAGAARGTIAVGCADGSVMVWRLRGGLGGSIAAQARAHSDAVTAVAVEPRGAWTASGGRDGRVLLWRYDQSEPEAIADHEGTVNVLLVTKRGHLLTIGEDRRAFLIDPASKPLSRLAAARLDVSATVGTLVSSDIVALGTRTGELLFLQQEYAQKGRRGDDA